MSEDTERNIAVIKRGLEAFAAGDMETAMSLFDDNIEWIQPGESAISGTYHGKRELSDWFGRVTQKSATVKPIASSPTATPRCRSGSGAESRPRHDS